MAVFVLIFFTLPECPSNRAGSFSSLPVILKRPALLELYALTMITVLGQFTVYSYFSPILSTVGGLAEGSIVDMLFLFGLAGIAGTIIGSKTVERHRSAGLLVPLFLIAASHVLLVTASANMVSLSVLIFIWGAAMTTVCLAFQTLLLSAAPDAADVATSLYSGSSTWASGAGPSSAAASPSTSAFIP